MSEKFSCSLINFTCYQFWLRRGNSILAVYGFWLILKFENMSVFIQSSHKNEQYKTFLLCFANLEIFQSFDLRQNVAKRVMVIWRRTRSYVWWSLDEGVAEVPKCPVSVRNNCRVVGNARPPTSWLVNIWGNMNETRQALSRRAWSYF